MHQGQHFDKYHAISTVIIFHILQKSRGICQNTYFEAHFNDYQDSIWSRIDHFFVV